MLDFLADFVVYGGFLVGVAIARSDARVACAALRRPICSTTSRC